MTNIELQSIIDIGDICIIGDYIDDEQKFVGYEYCKWIKYAPTGDSCRRCKGKMIFENLFTGITGEGGCHSLTKSSSSHVTDIEIIKKAHKTILVSDVLSKELFEI